jgi:hypothetical protein
MGLQPEAFLELGFAVNSEIVEVAKENYSGILATQLSEDLNNHGKNAKKVKGNKSLATLPRSSVRWSGEK